MKKILIYKNRSLHYQETGAGPDVLLLHGFGEDHRVWDSAVDHLKDSFHLIIPDLPGSGDSEAIDDMSIDGMAEAMTILMPQGPISVIGHSMGGYISLALLEKYPHRLNSLGLFHSTSYADTEEKKANRRKSIDFIKHHGAFEYLKTTIPNLFSLISRQKMPGAVNDFIARQHNFSADSLVSYCEAMFNRPDRRHLLKNSTIPILFLLGKHDYAIPFSDGLEQSHLPEKSYIHILRRSGHMGMMEEMETANSILKDYLSVVQSQ
jgi:pimeloyl-ACP methyl ester carboxylesterase